MFGDKNIVIWGVLLVTLLVCAGWHIRENKQLMRTWRENFGEDSAQWLIRFAWSRTVQFLLALACLTLITITYDWQLSDLRQTLKGAVKITEDQKQKIDQLTSQNKDLQIAQANQAAQTKTEPVILQNIPTPSSQPPSGVEELYSPEETTSGKQAALDSLKKRYEELLVTYFFLKKCGKAPASDYHIIISALSQEMASINAPGRLQHDIVTAAKGSYKEMYSTSSCTGPDLATTHAPYSNYINALSKNFVSQ